MSEKVKSIPLLEAYNFANGKELSHQVAEIRSMEIEWDRSYNSSVRKGRMIRLLKDNNYFDEFIENYWPTGNTLIGEKRIRKVLNIAVEYDNYISGNTIDEVDQFEQDEASFEFALESHLRDFLAKDLEVIEPGLKLFETDGRSGIEYPIDGGRIDILAVDQSDRIVAIELKVSRGRNKALGQLLYYMGWIDTNLGSKPCRGIIIASEISRELEIAVSRASGVSVFNYKMSFSVDPVK